MRWALGVALMSLLGCAGTPVVQQPTAVEAPRSASSGPRVGIEGGGLVLIEEGGSTPLVVYFEVDSDVIEPRLFDALDALALFLRNHGGALEVEVQGHADERGSDAYNDALSLRRARAVERYLVQHGVPEQKLAATGFGERRPLPSLQDRSAGGHRRVEFVIQSGATLASASY